MSGHTRIIAVSSEHENSVENFVHEIRKQADEAHRFGVEIEVERIDVEEVDVEGFDE